MKSFMDNFSVFGNDFSSCLANLSKVLHRCMECNLTSQLGKMSFYGERRYCARIILSRGKVWK